MESPEIKTDRLLIIPFAERHLTQQYVDWLNDRELMKFSTQRYRTHNLAACRDYWRSFNGTPHFFWAVELADNEMTHIGNINAYVDDNSGVADVGVLIGSGAQKKGYATEALRAVIDYLMQEVGCRKVTMGTISPNQGMIKVMEKLGMAPDGVRKGQQLYADHPVDVVHMAIFDNEAS